MPTLAQTRLAALSNWFDRNSRWGTTPNGATMIVGRYASIIPWAFDTPPLPDADPQAMLFYVSQDQCGDVSLADCDPSEPIDSHRDIAERIEHVLWLAEDGKLPPCIIVGLEDALEPIAAAVARAGLAATDLDALPVLALPLGALADGPRGRLAARLPFVAKADAPMPDMPADYVPSIVGVRDLWP